MGVKFLCSHSSPKLSKHFARIISKDDDVEVKAKSGSASGREYGYESHASQEVGWTGGGIHSICKSWNMKFQVEGQVN